MDQPTSKDRGEADLSLHIRVEAGRSLGMGHFMRCLALAEEWSTRDFGPVLFYSENLPPVAEVKLRSLGVDRVSPAMAPKGRRSGLWLIDGRQFSDEEVATWLDGAKVSIIIDDLGLRSHYPATFIINQNLAAEPMVYEGKTGDKSILLNGPAYALLRREITDVISGPGDKQGVSKLLVVLGGSDPHGLTSRFCRWLDDMPSLDLSISAVVGPAAQSTNKFPEGVEVLRQPADWPQVMLNHDLVLSAAGTTLLELAALGRPGLWVSNNEGEVVAAQTAQSLGFGTFLGPVETVTQESLQAKLVSLLEAPETLRAMAMAGQRLVDGRGVARVVEQLLGAAAAEWRE